MDLRKLKTLIDLVSESNISELEITEADGKVRIVKSEPAGAVMAPAAHMLQMPAPAAAPIAPAAAPVAAAPVVPADAKKPDSKPSTKPGRSWSLSVVALTAKAATVEIDGNLTVMSRP